MAHLTNNTLISMRQHHQYLSNSASISTSLLFSVLHVDKSKQLLIKRCNCFHYLIITNPILPLPSKSKAVTLFQLVTMTSNYFNCLKKSHLPKIFPFPCLSFFPFFSSQRFINTANLSDKDSSKKEQTFLSLFKKCFTMRDVEKMHSHVIKLGFDQNLYVIGKIIVFCAVNECGLMDYAVSVFEKIENPDGFLWNTMIRGFGRIGQVESVFDYYKRMQEMGELADNFTFSFLLKVSGQLGLVMLGKQIHCIAMKHGLEGHVFVRNTLIHMYGMFKDIGTAHELFEEIPSSDLVAWNTIIDCHVYCGKYKEALELFLRMRQNDIEPDEATLVVTLSACAASGALDFGRWVHSCIDHTRYSCFGF